MIYIFGEKKEINLIRLVVVVSIIHLKSDISEKKGFRVSNPTLSVYLASYSAV